LSVSQYDSKVRSDLFFDSSESKAVIEQSFSSQLGFNLYAFDCCCLQCIAVRPYGDALLCTAGFFTCVEKYSLLHKSCRAQKNDQVFNLPRMLKIALFG